MGKGDYRVSDIYQGGYSGLVPPSSNYMAAGSFGMTTDPRSANILQEVSTKLNMGVKNIEVTAISPESFDSMPTQHLKEVNRLAKLTGIDITLHGPLIEASGVGQQGYSESERETAQRKITSALKRSHDLNPDGNIPVTFHSSNGLPGSQLMPPGERKEGRYKKMIVINRDDGKSITSLEPEVEYHPGGELEPKTRTPERRIESLNSTEWKNSLFGVEVNRENAERVMKDVHPIFISQFAKIQAQRLNPNELNANEIDQIKKVSTAFEFIEQAKQKADSLFSKAVEMAKKDGDQEKIQMLTILSKEYGKEVGLPSTEGGAINAERYYNPKVYSEALYNLTRILEKMPPKTWVPIEEFAVEKSAQTFGNATYEAYKQFKDKAPITVIENPPAGGALSTGGDIRDIVVASRKQFVNNAMEPQNKGGLGMSKSEAEKKAEKFIGATWDVGHINMLRGQGYSEKDIIKETEVVAPYVKHVHLSDNFGLEHTELPMGMGNVPIKEMMEKLGQKGFEAKKIIEAGHWWQHFKTSPFQETLEATGSPLYSMHMAPYWSQAPGLYQSYSSGYGQMLPQINYETFGAGFSRLPTELGGSAQGAQGSRMSGRQME